MTHSQGVGQRISFPLVKLQTTGLALHGVCHFDPTIVAMRTKNVKWAFSAERTGLFGAWTFDERV